MTPDRAEMLILELCRLRQQMEELRVLQDAILKQFSVGRTEGQTLAVYRAPDGYKKSVSIRRLRRHVDEKTINLCTESKTRRGAVRIVPKNKVEVKP